MIELKRFIGGWALGTLYFLSLYKTGRADQWAAMSIIVGILPGLIVWGLWP